MKKDVIKNIESRHNVEIKIVPDPDLEASSFEIDNEGLSESEFKNKLKNHSKDNRKNRNDESADGIIIQDKEVALMSAVAPKTKPPKPKTTETKRGINNKPSIFRRFLNILFGTKEKSDNKNKRPRRYYNKNRRYNKNFKYNKYKSNNKRNFSGNKNNKN